MKSNLLFLFLFLLVLAPFVSAQPPFQQTTILDKGIQVQIIIIEPQTQNELFQYHLHAHNASNGLLLKNDTIDFCSIHIFDKNGIHILIINMTYNEERLGWQFDVLKGNFSRLGAYDSLFYCEVSGEIGGFIEHSFEVTADGFERETFPKEFSVILFGLLLIIFGLSKERYRMLKHVGGILWIIMGVLTLYPGYGFINWTTLLGKALGFILIGGGFYIWLEDSFSRDEQDGYFEQGEEKKEKEVSE